VVLSHDWSFYIMSASSPPTDCAVLRSVSNAVLTWFQAQVGVKEESLTDWLLYETTRQSPRFFYQAFTRHQEARKTGADWEWWIVFARFGLKLRVQAKKTYQARDHYSDLAYTNKYGLQIQKLLNDAKTTNSVPLYALYSAITSKVMCPKGPQSEGVFLVSANKIFSSFISVGPKFVSDVDLLSIATPLSCLLCCTVASDSADFVYHYFPEGLEPSMTDSNDRQGIHSKLPTYVTSILESRDGIPSWWAGEFEREVTDVDALLIYDARK
jgi:hypothetical protein